MLFFKVKIKHEIFCYGLFIFATYDQRLALKRLIDISMGVVTPLTEQLTKPLPNAIVLVNLKQLSTGAYKLLPEGNILFLYISFASFFFLLRLHRSCDVFVL